MGASRKLQGEIDRVLKKVHEGLEVFDSTLNKVYETDNANQKEKYEGDAKKEIKKLQRYRDQIKTWMQSSEIKDKKISASYEQALLDSRKQIERAMEKFKICERESKTKAFSKEGLGQQPKTDPREKAKSETRDWINNVVGELELQIDNFEAEIEGLSVKKGKTRPPRLVHLDTSIARHKAHIMKLELILRLLDNDELSPEEVNDVREFLDDYVDRNQEDFDDFKDVDGLYESLPLDKVEALEEIVVVGPPSLVKGNGPTSSVLTSKTPLATSAPPRTAELSLQPSAPVQEIVEDAASKDIDLNAGPRSPPAKTNLVGSSTITNPPGSHASTVPSALESVASSVSTDIPDSVSWQGSASSGLIIPLNLPVSPKEEPMDFTSGRSSPVLADAGPSSMSRTSRATADTIISSGAVPDSSLSLSSIPSASEVTKRNISGADERVSSSVVSGRVFPSSVGRPVQWGPGSSLQNQNEIRGRPEIAPDQREKFLEKYQQVQQQQQGHDKAHGMPTLRAGNFKPFSGQPSPLPQLNCQSSSLPSRAGQGNGVQVPSHNTSMPMSLSQPSIHHQAAQQGSIVNGPRDTGIGHAIAKEQLQPNLEDPATETVPDISLVKNLIDDEVLRTSSVKDVLKTDASNSLIQSTRLPRDSDISPGLPLNTSQPSGSLGVIGRRSVPDLGAVGDAVGGAMLNDEELHEKMYYLQMLEAAFHNLPQPKDSERVKSFIPRRPVATPSSFPQVQLPLVNSSDFWEHLGKDQTSTDILFFAFYYQQNTCQQYLAARELKKQLWRYHKEHNAWFQRQKEPEVVNDDFERGSYIYFDFHAMEELQQGWCKKVIHNFQFEYNHLEDELIV